MSGELPEVDPFDQWLAALLAGGLEPADGERFARRLREDPAARRRYVELVMLHGMLQWEFSSATAAAAEEAKEAQGSGIARSQRASPMDSANRGSPATDAGASSPRPTMARRLRRGRRALRWTMNIAAALAVSALLAWQFGPWSSIATLVDAQGARWSGADQPAGVGAGLRRQTLHLVEGIGELRFRNGATVILQGPAELELRSPTQVKLLAGRLVARAPDGAHGFAVEAAGMEVVDLGTEFGVSAVDGKPEVQVFEGAVEAGAVGARDQGDRERLGLGQAARFDARSGKMEAAEFTGAGFVRALPDELADPALTQGLLAWWKFDDEHGVVAADSSGNNHPGTLHNCSFDQDGTAGKFGRALAFDGSDTCVTVPWHDDFVFGAMTIQAWIKPRSSQPPDAQIISQVRGFGLAVPKNSFMKYYFWDRDALMAYRFDADRWCHLVATFDGRERVFYVDGVRIGTFASPPPRLVHTELRIGTLYDDNPGTHFHGLIDDLRIYGRALTAEEVRRLFLSGAVGSP